jgi:hypothetical protein
MQARPPINNPHIDGTMPPLHQMLALMRQLPDDIASAGALTPDQGSKAAAVAHYADEICRTIGGGLREFGLTMSACERVMQTNQMREETEAYKRMIDYLASELQFMRRTEQDFRAASLAAQS